MRNNRITVAFFDETGTATAVLKGSVPQIWANANEFGTSVRILTNTQWETVSVENLPNISEIPENAYAQTA